MPFAAARYMIGRDSPVQNTGPDGKFRFTGLRPGQRLSVVTNRKGYVDQVVPGITAPLEEPLEIELQLGSRVSGRVLDTAGTAVKGAQVSLGSVSRRMVYAGPGQSVESDEEGRFQLEGIEPGTMVLTARAGGFKESTLSGLVVKRGDSATNTTLELWSAAKKNGGSVIDPQNQRATHMVARDAQLRTRIRRETIGLGRFGRVVKHGRFHIPGHQVHVAPGGALTTLGLPTLANTD